MPYGVYPERTGDPKVTSAPVDRQRLYKAGGVSQGMLGSAGTNAVINRARPGAFKVRKKRY